MDPVYNPAPVTASRRSSLRAPLAMAVIVALLLAASILGSAIWRPESVPRRTLDLGAPAPVGLETRTADETISRVRDVVSPTVAFLRVPAAGRSGSGVVVHEAGFVVTNAHVVNGIDELLVVFEDGAQYPASVYGIDTATDLAVVKLDAPGPFPTAALGNSDELRVGEFVVALGAPFGLAASVTSGIISGLNRDGLGIARYEDFIVTDAPINRGNSGGPLVNLRGEVIGINTAIIAGEEEAHGMGGFAGVGFAIPVNLVRVVAQRLIGDGGLVPPEGGEMPVGAEDAGTASLLPGSAARTVAAQSVGEPPTGMDDTVAYIGNYGRNGRLSENGVGFVVASNIGNLLMTNAHVVDDAGQIAVFFPGDRRAAFGAVVASDLGLDLALVSWPGSDTRTPLPIAGSAGAAVEDTVTAWAARAEGGIVDVAANPGKLVATGLVNHRLATRATLIETDAAIRRGDSGGPLLNGAGSVIGVMVARESDGGGGDTSAHSFAIELYPDENLEWMIGLAEDPGFPHGFDPAYPVDRETGEDRPYITVLSLDPDSALWRAGLRSLDRITAIDGVPIAGSAHERRVQLQEFKRLSPGTDVPLSVSRARDDGSGERDELIIPFRVPDQ